MQLKSRNSIKLKLVALLFILTLVYVYSHLSSKKTNHHHRLQHYELLRDNRHHLSRNLSQDLLFELNFIFDIKKDEKYLKKLSQRNLLNKSYVSNCKTILEQPQPQQQQQNKQIEKELLIIEYTNVFFAPKFCSHSNEQIFNSKLEKCSYQNCKYECDKSEEAIRTAHALVFHQRDLEAELELKYGSNLNEWLSKTTQFPFKNTPDKLRNNPNQVWILWNDEATKIDEKFNQISSLFNWTMSYRTNSEIYHGVYGFFIEQNNHEIINKEAKIREAYEMHFRKRVNAILWFVNNCKSKKRFHLALELSKHYPVYIYTQCKLNEMTDSNNMNESEFRHLKLINDKCDKGSECERVNFEHFKYYLAFENKNCSDYITEKVWKSLANHMIPIVMQPGMDSFVRYEIPSKSFIHLKEFDFNAKRLAQHLRNIDAHFPLYFDYIKWTLIYFKTYYENEYTEPHRMCKMCEALNKQFSSDSMSNMNRIHYNNVASFFNEQQCIS
jgi:glycoprotein 3-alpha-L-fucosyltransferase